MISIKLHNWRNYAECTHHKHSNQSERNETKQNNCDLLLEIYSHSSRGSSSNVWKIATMPRFAMFQYGTCHTRSQIFFFFCFLRICSLHSFLPFFASTALPRGEGNAKQPKYFFLIVFNFAHYLLCTICRRVCINTLCCCRSIAAYISEGTRAPNEPPKWLMGKGTSYHIKCVWIYERRLVCLTWPSNRKRNGKFAVHVSARNLRFEVVPKIA